MSDSLTSLESALRHERTRLVAALFAIVGVCWLWIVVLARDMYGPMSGASAWMMTSAWDPRHLVLLWAMWAVMMAGMMLPSATPLLFFYGVAARRAGDRGAASRVYVLAAGYLTVWALFSMAMTGLQRLLASALVLSPMMQATGTRAAAVLLVIAGAYQVTPAKHACLSQCQSPLRFLMTRWRRGTSGAFRMGVEHGAYCVGCCWALMLILFAGGVMNLVVIAALTAFVAFEKLAPFGVQSARVSGALLMALGVILLLR